MSLTCRIARIVAQSEESAKDAKTWGRPRRLLLTMATPEAGWKAPAPNGSGSGGSGR